MSVQSKQLYIKHCFFINLSSVGRAFHESFIYKDNPNSPFEGSPSQRLGRDDLIDKDLLFILKLYLRG